MLDEDAEHLGELPSVEDEEPNSDRAIGGEICELVLRLARENPR
jgi:hypothetical protein